MSASNVSSSSKDILIEKLASLLGFEDGASDVLDHLLTIESKEDLLEYLMQLLGRDDDVISTFVDDLDRYNRGESISMPSNSTGSGKNEGKQESVASCTSKVKEIDQKIAAAAALHTTRRTTPSKIKKQQLRNNNSGINAKKSMGKTSPKEPVKGITNNNTTSSSSQQKKTNDSSIEKHEPEQKNESSSSSKQTESAASKLSPQKATSTARAKSREGPRPPQKGERTSKVCGCFGVQHKPLTNCLHCGRISCEIEGYDYCPFCSYLLEEFIPSGDTTDDAATKHKERLLQFDRDFTRRTTVVDDQADYYNANDTSSAAWLSSKEQKDAISRDEKRREELHQRQKQTLNIAF